MNPDARTETVFAMWMEGWGDLPGHLVVISGPSGSGKSTLVRRVLERPEVRAVKSISATTRKPRPGEQHGVNYFFVSNDEFLEHARIRRAFSNSPSLPGTSTGPRSSRSSRACVRG